MELIVTELPSINMGDVTEDECGVVESNVQKGCTHHFEPLISAYGSRPPQL